MRRKSSEKGQIVVEYTLLLLVVIGLSSLVVSTLRSSNMMKNLVFEPFAKLNGMIQCGTWDPCGLAARAANRHPNSETRILSLRAEGSPQ